VHQAPTARDPDHSGYTHYWAPPWTEVRSGRPERASTHGEHHELRTGEKHEQTTANSGQRVQKQRTNQSGPSKDRLPLVAMQAVPRNRLALAEKLAEAGRSVKHQKKQRQKTQNIAGIEAIRRRGRR
jgi:hypothetical protein